jgi:hypothetical protein
MRIGKNAEGSCCGLMQGNIRHSLGEIEENYGKFSEDTRSLGRDLNSEPPEYEVGVFTTKQ